MPELLITDQNFVEQIIKSKDIALVDFWAPWCGPCRLQGPIIEELNKEFEGKPVKIGKLNVDENPETAQHYNVMSIPTLVIFKNGQVVEMMTGLRSKEDLSEKLNNLLK